MIRTKAIVLLAALLALVAVLVAQRGQKPPEAPPTPIPGGKAGNLSLSSTLSGTYLLHQGTGDVYLDISLDALKKKARSERIPVNVGLVIDRSGSMAGQKLEHAKEAARRLVSSLDDGDRLALITYGSDVSVLISSSRINATTRETILSAIEGIVDRGGTFLSGGFEQGRDEVLAHGQEGYLNRVILISDGQANEGITATGELSRMARGSLERGVHLTTMGVGLDFNENLMTAMAEHGGGHYYFIKDSSSMASIFSKELETLTTTVARGAKMEILLEPDVELVHLFGYTYEKAGRRISIRLPDIYGGQQRKLICQLRVPVSEEGTRPVARVELTFTDVESEKTTTVASVASVSVTRDQDKVERGVRRDVLARVEQVNISKSLNEAMEAYSDGKVDQAQQVLNAQIDTTARANLRLKSGKLDDLMNKMKRQLRQAQEAQPSSEAGRSLVKGAKFDAYKLAK